MEVNNAINRRYAKDLNSRLTYYMMRLCRESVKPRNFKAGWLKTGWLKKLISWLAKNSDQKSD